MRIQFVFVCFLACAPILLAEQPAHQTVEGIYVLRSYLRNGQSASAQGIWQFDDAARTYRLISRFPYGGNAGDGVNIEAFHDRLVVQQSTFTEFDLATGRMLRRYDALPPRSGMWTFHGELIRDEEAAALGLPSGYYGFPICFPYLDFTGCGASIQPPGWEEPSSGNSRFDVLLQRGLDPADSDLHLVTRFPAGYRRTIALDPGHRRFLIWKEHRDSTYTRQLAVAEIGGGTIQAENPLDTLSLPNSSPDLRNRDLMALAYESQRNSVLVTTRSPFDYDVRVLRLTLDLKSEETLDASNGNPFPTIPVTITTVPSTAPADYVQVIPAVGSGLGAHGTIWQSDVWIYNPSPQPTTVTIRRVASQVRPSVSQVVPGHGTIEIRDALRKLGGGPAGDGQTTDALVISALYRWGKQLAVYSRTYTEDERGSYGQSVPAVPSHVGYSTHLSSFSEFPSSVNTWSFFHVDYRDRGRFRHNVGIVNDDDRPLTVRLRYAWDRDTTPQDPELDKVIDVRPHAVANVNIEQLFGQRVISNYAGRVSINADRPAPVWLSMVDNLTGDATFIPYMLFGYVPAVDSRVVIPAVAHTSGVGGTQWQTDVYGFFLNAFDDETDQSPFATFFPTTQSGCTGDVPFTRRLQGVGSFVPDDPDLEWLPKWYTVFPDVVGQFTPCQTEGNVVGGLSVRANPWMAGFSRTYTTRSDGGTYGDMLPFYESAGWPEQHFAGLRIDDNYRANVGLFNATDVEVRHHLLLYAIDGRLVAEATIGVAPYQLLQGSVEGVFGQNIPAGLYGLSVIPLDEPGHPGRCWSYVSIIDNRSGDPTNLW